MMGALFLIFAFAMELSQKTDQQWISRCFDLAKRGIGYVSPNPPVGAVLVHNDGIIGEGFHPVFGGPHAEVEAFGSVPENKRHLLPESILYVSLEPCCIYAKTPPCTDLIIREGVRKVRISALDPNPKIAGRGIDILRQHGIEATTGILEEKGRDLIRMFRTNILFERPHVILKWAQSANGYIGQKDERIMLSHPYTNTWSHGMRSAVDAIMVGARTVMTDDPKLTTRDAPGRSPHRAVYDPNGFLKRNYQVFEENGTRVFYFSVAENPGLNGEHIMQFKLNDSSSHIDQMLVYLYAQQIGSLMVEGGAHLLNLFIKEHKWNEGWVIRTKHALDNGIQAPNITGQLIQQIESATDMITGIMNEKIEMKI